MVEPKRETPVEFRDMMDTARWPFARFADGAAGPIVCSQSLLLHQYLMLSSISHGADSARQHPRGAFPSRLPLYMHSPRRLDLPTSFLLSLFSSRLLHKSERAKNRFWWGNCASNDRQVVIDISCPISRICSGPFSPLTPAQYAITSLMMYSRLPHNRYLV